MEIEYKFGIGNSETFEFLSRMTEAGNYLIQDKSHPLFTDIFYDTPDFLLYSLGFYLRKRLEDGRSESVWTLKKSGDSSGGSTGNLNRKENEEAHKRYEIIQILPLDSTAEDISDPDFRKMLTNILGNLKVIPILTLEQDRIFKTVYQKGITESDDLTLSKNRLGDLSVDSVSLQLTEQKHTFTELEIELANGTESELEEFITALKNLPELQNNLSFNRFSKFERGLILWFNRDKIEGKVISGFENKSYYIESDYFETQEDDSDADGNDADGSDEDGGAGSRTDRNTNVGGGTEHHYEYDSSGSGFLLPREKAALMQICGKDYTADPTDYFGKTGFLTHRAYSENTDKSNDFGLKSTDIFTQNAAVLLSTDSGMSAGFAAQVFDLTEQEINRLREKFEQNRLEIFPFVFETGRTEQYYYQKPIDDGKIWTAEELAGYYGSDVPQTKKRAQNAEKLFDYAGFAHGLEAADRKILTAAAQLFDIGNGISSERNINIGADIILTHPIEKLTLNEIKTLALIFVLREAGITKKPSFEKIREAVRGAGFFVPPAYQKKAFIITAFLDILKPVADSDAVLREIKLRTESKNDENQPDYANQNSINRNLTNQNSINQNVINQIKQKRNPVLEITYIGGKKQRTASDISGSFLKRKDRVYADFLFDFTAEYKRERIDGTESEEDLFTADLKNSGLKIESTDMMSVAAGKILAARFYEVRKSEKGVITATDIEDVHEMRVALRKMRSANLIFKDFLDQEWLMKTEVKIKETLSGLGTLRDLDVLLEKTDEWRKAENIGQERMSVFYEFVSNDRKQAHVIVVDYMNSDGYIKFMTGLQETFEEKLYLGVPYINKKGDVAPSRICDVLPGILYEKAAAITAYHEWMDGPYIYVDKLHRLRIAAKNFRYTLDFFKDCLGDAAGQLIKEFKELQDILGDFHDAVVAAEVIDAYIQRIQEKAAQTAAKTVPETADESLNPAGENRLKEIEITLDTLNIYKNYREQEMEKLIAAFHEKWEKMNRRFFSERIAKIISEADF